MTPHGEDQTLTFSCPSLCDINIDTELEGIDFSIATIAKAEVEPNGTDTLRMIPWEGKE
ncbi:hypothetical protein E2C01_069957 [Portunus trituberculatus]|uniref:Uncharacterized protein n=1 Tax=Portunus trituberculatus TaxID=210409 RepID=A0A5B7I2A0_PORTR|nr:hypothetical protein [Portunus trituberculatus]